MSEQHEPMTDADVAAMRAALERARMRFAGAEPLPFPLMRLVAEVERLRAALQEVRSEGGKVCNKYEICEHASCASSYAAWAIADKTLKGQ